MILLIVLLVGLIDGVPDWLEWAVGIFTALFGSGYIGKKWDTWFPSARQKIEWVKSDQSDFVKTYGQAIDIHKQLTDQLGQMVEAKTSHLTKEVSELKTFLADREIEHKEEKELYIERALEIKKKLDDEIELRMTCLRRLDATERELRTNQGKLNEYERQLADYDKQLVELRRVVADHHPPK